MLHGRYRFGLAFIAALALMVPSFASRTIAAPSKAPLTATFLGQWTSAEETDFKAILNYCQQHYNVQTNYEIATNMNQQLSTAVQGGNPPDLAALSTPSSIAPFVQGHSLQPLSFLNKSTLKKDFSPFWRTLGTVDGKLYAVYMKADVKSLVWYDPQKFNKGHYKIPKTWAQLIALSNQMIKQGKQPWAFGVGGNPASPWTLTDFIENIVLQQSGPGVYKKWINHQIKWTDPRIEKAFQVANQIIGNNKMIAGGRSKALSQAWDQGASQMVTDPKAEFFQEATFVGAGLAGDLPSAKPGKQYSAFAFPTIGTRKYEPVEVGPNGIVMFKSTPGSQALVKCLIDPNAQKQWAKLGGYISPNNNFPLSAYPDPVFKLAAKDMVTAGQHGILVGDASDLMPVALGSTYEFTALQKWFENPSSYKTILSQIEAQAKNDYKGFTPVK
jgi:alpha-glucoside transport system substrate-binding protein